MRNLFEFIYWVFPEFVLLLCGVSWLFGYIAGMKSERCQPLTDDTRRIDSLAKNSWDLCCFDMPTGQGDSDIGWRVIEHHMAKPHERVIAEVHYDNPRRAIDVAIKASHGIKVDA